MSLQICTCPILAVGKLCPIQNYQPRARRLAGDRPEWPNLCEQKLDASFRALCADTKLGKPWSHLSSGSFSALAKNHAAASLATQNSSDVVDDGDPLWYRKKEKAERVEELPLKAIRRPLGRTRANDPEKVQWLMGSIAEIGLQEPIDVLEVDGVYYGFSGCHRYEAHQRLGMETIRCRVRKATREVLRMHLA